MDAARDVQHVVAQRREGGAVRLRPRTQHDADRRRQWHYQGH